MAPQRQAGGKLGLRAASSEKRRRWNRIHCHWYRTQSGSLYSGIVCSAVVSYTIDEIVIIVDSIRHYCTQSKVAQCVGMTLHSGKIEQTQQCGSTDRPNLVWRTEWHTTDTQWYCCKHSQRGICHVLLHTLSQVLQLSVYSKSVWPGPNTAPATSCQRRSKCLVSQTFCKSLLLCRSKCQRTPTGVT